MNALALSIFTTDPKFEKFLSSEKYLRAGNRLRGRVRDIRSNGKLLMDFGKFRVLARVNFPVELDEALDVVVLENRDQLRLGLIHPKHSVSPMITRGISPFKVSVPASLNHFETDIEKVIARHAHVLKPAGFPREVFSALSKVSDHFSPLKIDGTILEIIGQLKSRTLNSGLFFEKRLEHALSNSQGPGTDASVKHLLRLPAIREILANDLKPVLWPLRQSLKPVSYGTNYSGKEMADPIRRIVGTLVHQIDSRQKCAVGRELNAGPDKSLSSRSPGAAKVQKETIPRLMGLISRFMHRLESYAKASGGIIQKEIQQALIKTSGSAKALISKLPPVFDERGTKTGKSLRPGVQQNEPFSPVSHLSARSGAPTGTAVAEPVRSEAASRTGQVRQSVHRPHPAVFKPNLPADLVRALAEMIARMKAAPDPSAGPPETILDSHTVQPKEPVEFVEINRVISRELMPGLLTLDRYLNTKDNANPDVIENREGLHRTVKDLLTVIRHFQGQSRTVSEPVPEQAQVFSYDFFIKGSEQRAKLKVYYPRKKKGKQKQVFKASLFLSMDKIGDIRTDFSLWEKSMNITFHVGGQEVKNTIEKNLDQIIPNLKKTVETLTIKVKVTEKAVEQVETGWADSPGDNIIDVRI